MREIPREKITCFRGGEPFLRDAETGQPLPDDHKGLLQDGEWVMETGINEAGERYFKVVGKLKRGK